MNLSVTQLADRLIASYAAVGGINHLDGANLPSRSAMAGICTDLLRLLFPGFFDDRTLHSSELKVFTTTLLDSVQARLEDEVCKSLEYAPPAGADGREPRAMAHAITCRVLGLLPGVRELLQTDSEAAYQGDPAALSQEEVIVAYPFIETIAIQRVAHLLYLQEVPLIPRMMTEWAHGRTGIDLHPGAQIGSHFFIDHGTGTVIGETAQIGSHVKLYQGVGLVARSLSGGQALRGKKRHPTIEDSVTLYAGATIVGGETTIGSGSTIGANVFVMHSVPPNSLVLYEDVKIKVISKGQREQPSLDFQI